MTKKIFIIIDEARRSNAIAYINTLEADGTSEIEIRPFRKTRTKKQNAALWAVAYPPIMESMGMRGEKEKEEIHEYFCGEYFGWKQYEILGKLKSKPVRTTTVDEEGKRNRIKTKQMAGFYSFIQQRAADNGIYVPDPDPMYGLTNIDTT